MKPQRATYKIFLSSDEIIKYGLINNKLVIPYFPNKYNSDFVVLRKYNVVYHEMSGEMRAVPTKTYCLALKNNIHKDDFFPKFYYTKKVLIEDSNWEVLLGEKTKNLLKNRNAEKYNEIFKFHEDEKEFSYPLLVALYESRPDFSPTKLKLFIEKVLLSCIKDSSFVKKAILYNTISSLSTKEDVMYYCFFPKLCYYIYNYSSFTDDIQQKIITFVDDLILRLNSTDTSKLITNIDLEILCKVLTEKERC